MNIYKEPEMDEVKLEDEDLKNVSGGACVSKQHLDDGKYCSKIKTDGNNSGCKIIIVS